MKLALRALATFLAVPGVAAGLLPLAIARGGPRFGGTRGAGLVALAIGTVCLLACVRDFLVSGRGTLAPWDPPKALVIVGLYRFVRNPMYLSVLAIVLGWCLFFGSARVALYLVALAIGFHLRVILSEEPWMRRQFGPDGDRYLDTVPHWVPRFRAGAGSPPRRPGG